MARVFDTLHDKELVSLLQHGSVGVIPTDTVYGLVCRAADEAAVARLYALKNRQKKPGTIIAASVEQLVELGIKARYLKPVEHYWPNPISIIIPNYELAYIHLGVGSIAMRIPKDTQLSGLLNKTGPLLTTSANHAGQVEATNLEQAQKYFDDEVDFYVDGGGLSGGKPSTLIRIVDDAVEVLRQGAVTIKENGEIER
jgi:L-threonylcarbamoyladenylate synthase